MNRPTRRFAQPTMALLALALAGCGESPPPGYAPAGFMRCPDLSGTYRVDSATDLALSGAMLRMPDYVSELYLVIEQQGEQGARATLRRPVANVMREAEVLQSRSPATYRKWRQQVRILQGDEPPPVGVPYGEALADELGPFVMSSSSIPLGECASGWYELWPIRRLPAGDGMPDREVALALSANESGLLVRTRTGTSNDTGLQFFGQSVGYYTYGEGEYHRLPRAPLARDDFHLDPPELPAASDAAGAAAVVTLLDRDESLRNFDRGLRARLPQGVRLSIVRRVLFEPTAIGAPAARMAIEVSAWCEAGVAPDALELAIRADPRTSGIEVRRSESPPGKARYVLLRVDYDIVAHDTAPGSG